jgi:hypothetical protein
MSPNVEKHQLFTENVLSELVWQVKNVLQELKHIFCDFEVDCWLLFVLL